MATCHHVVKDESRLVTSRAAKVKYTQVQVGKALGVARETARNWLAEKRPDGQKANVSRPHAQVKVAGKEKAALAARAAKALGVARETVRNWFGPNGQKAKGAKAPKRT